MALFNAYSPKDVLVTWAGIPITGYAEDSFLRMKRNSDVNGYTVGTAGDVALTTIADATGEIEIELMQTAPSNSLISAIYVAQTLSGDITVLPITITDPSGSVIAIANNAYIKTLPDIDLGKEQNSKTWVFGCTDLQYLDASAAGDTGMVGGF